ncbi:MAG: B12-binding domain-containing radical SAM protein [Candidatus Odinarchaeota archaeon]
MKILLVTPPGKEVSERSKYSSGIIQFTQPPLGLAYIAAFLLENGFTRVKILDSHALEVTHEDYERIIKHVKPDIVGIQVMTPNFNDAIFAARIAKEHGSTVVMGGHHPTFMPEETLVHSRADYVVFGEGEDIFLSLVQAIDKGNNTEKLPGIAYLRDGKLVKNEIPLLRTNIDEFPIPARHLLPMDKYAIFGSKFPATTIISSRGCPYGCDFCVVTHFYGKRWRPRSPENIVEELRDIGNLGLKASAFVDDLFFISEKRVLKICREIQNELDVDMFWGATTRIDRVTRKTMRVMVDSGCRLVFAGVESGNQETLDQINKKITVSQVETFFKNSREAKMDTLASLVFGLPGDTKQSIRATTKWVIDKLDPDIALFTVATPYPGTPFYEEALKREKIIENDYSKYNLFNPIIDIVGLSRDEVKEMVKEAYKKFYLRPSKAFSNTTREMRYAMESYGLKMFMKNGITFGKAILSLRGLVT